MWNALLSGNDIIIVPWLPDRFLLFWFSGCWSVFWCFLCFSFLLSNLFALLWICLGGGGVVCVYVCAHTWKNEQVRICFHESVPYLTNLLFKQVCYYGMLRKQYMFYNQFTITVCSIFLEWPSVQVLFCYITNVLYNTNIYNIYQL